MRSCSSPILASSNEFARARNGGTNLPSKMARTTSDRHKFKVGSGLMHSVFIIDLYSRLIVGWGLSNTSDTELCLKALRSACRDHGCRAIFQIDNGSQFTSRRFIAELRQHRIQQSMIGSRGWKDKVLVERFFWCIKSEWSRLRKWTCGSQARRAIAELLRYYNFVRDHGAVGRTPAKVHGVSDKISGEPLDPSGC